MKDKSLGPECSIKIAFKILSARATGCRISTGFSVGKEEKKLGIRGSDTRELIFEDCLVPEENIIGRPGDGFKILMKTFNYTRPAQ
jgi:alkylation response protein AidB-like acyl-CoA dehydrogenase